MRSETSSTTSKAASTASSYFVDDEMRHRGHGPALAAEALRWLDAHDEVRHIDALALPGDRAMKSLLEKAGFKARLLTMRRSN
jgi:RimJ/RimL family protein N-acetyltransferase